MKTVAKILIRNGRGEVLILRRSNTHPVYPLHIDLPGGEVEKNEDIKSALSREIKEETGLNINLSGSKLLFSRLYSGSLKHVLMETTLDYENPSITISWEHDTYEWLNIDKIINKKLPIDLDPYFKDVLDWLRLNSKDYF